MYFCKHLHVSRFLCRNFGKYHQKLEIVELKALFEHQVIQQKVVYLSRIFSTFKGRFEFFMLVT